MSASLDNIHSQLNNLQSQADLQQWQPELCGDIDIRIDSKADWYHEGDRIEREQLVKLFLSILRREDDGQFYLVTPVEKWRILVEDAPLLVTAIDVVAKGGPQQAVAFTLSNGDRQQLSRSMPLRVEYDAVTGEPSPYIDLPHGLFAKLTRSAFYHLANEAEIKGCEMGIRSQGEWMVIGRTE